MKYYKLHYFAILISISFLACTNTESDFMESKLKAVQNLKEQYGVEIVITDPDLFTWESIDEIKSKLQRSFPKTTRGSSDFTQKYKLIATSDNVAISKEVISIPRSKTESESAVLKNSCGSYNFEITLNWYLSSDSYSLDCKALYGKEDRDCRVETCDIKNDRNNNLSIKAKIFVIENVGGGYLHMPFYITGTYSISSRSGSVSISNTK